MEEDWRVALAHHVRGQSFRWKKYYAFSESWDHDHCEACGAKFMLNEEGSLTEGYGVSEDYKLGLDYAWLCADCFRDLAGIMDWHVIE